jgi:hypothetical protein
MKFLITTWLTLDIKGKLFLFRMVNYIAFSSCNKIISPCTCNLFEPWVPSYGWSYLSRTASACPFNMYNHQIFIKEVKIISSYIMILRDASCNRVRFQLDTNHSSFAIVHLGAFCIENAPTLVATRFCPVATGAHSGCNLFTSGCN